MASHHLFFRSDQTANLIDVLKPRQKPNRTIASFHFDPQHEKDYLDLVFRIMNDGEMQKLMGSARDGRPATKDGPPIYTASNMVVAKMVDFTSQKLEEGVRAFRTDFYSPVRREWFAYATPYGSGSFQKMMHEKGVDLDMVRFVDYKIGDPVASAIKGTFSTYDLSVLHIPAFQKYSGYPLALIVPSKLILRE